MKTFTIADIRSWDPCYDPARYLPEDWEGTVLDLLRIKAIPVEDRFWVVLREDLIDAKTLRLFAVWCARQVQHLMTDSRSIEAIDVAEKFALGEATQEELAAARVAARDAARVAAGDAAWVAARAAARDAARDAAGVAAGVAAWAAAGVAARDAAWAASGDAAWDAARVAAGAAAWDAQIKQLIVMLDALEEEESHD